MKKQTIFLFLMIMISALVIVFVPTGNAITQHQCSSGTTFGVLKGDFNDTRYEKYMVDDWTYAIYGDDIIGQTFTIGNSGENDNFYLSGIYVNISRLNNPGTIYCYLNDTTATGQPNNSLATITINSNLISTSFEWYMINFDKPYRVNKDTKYFFGFKIPDGNVNNYIRIREDHNGATYAGGKLWSYSEGIGWWSASGDDFNFAVYNNSFNVTRTAGISTEKNTIDFTIDFNLTDSILKIPVSTDVNGIMNVTNNSCDSHATEVSSLNSVTNNTYYFDASNNFVYIGTIDLAYNTNVNWTVNCSYGSNFSIDIPSYLEVGEYLMMNGLIENSTNVPISGFTARTYIYYENGTVAKGNNPPIKWNCTNGNYQSIISTTSLVPGVYTVEIEFTDTVSGITFRYGGTLYLSYDTPSGVYSDAIVYFNFYNTNIGLGLPRETLKLYVDGQRLYNNFYYTYTGNVINITVKDYYNTTLYQSNFTIDNTRTFLDLGLTFHSYLFGNKNDDYYMVSLLKQGGSRWWERGIVPYGEREFLIPSGSYMMRIYDKDNTEVYNTSAYNSVINSKVYVIHGTNLTEVISGQSVIRGQLLELQNEIDYALMPDDVIWSCNAPTIFSVYDKTGMMLGENVWKICPALDVIGTTRNSTLSNNTDSYPLIPTNGTTENGTITLLTDILYISGNGSVNYVNITYKDNCTLMQNTTYIPGKINLNGENLTISSNINIHLLRESTFSKVTKFYWNIYNSTTNPGHINNRAGYHSTVLDVVNTLNVPLYDVYVFAGFSDKTTPDINTVQVEDLENGVLLTMGEDFKVTNGIEFRISGGLNASTTRSFDCGYYKDIAHTYVYEDAQIEVNYYTEEKTFNDDGEFYNYAEFIWINDNDKAFRGSLRVKLDFDVDLDHDSVKVYDLDNNCLVDDEYIIVGDEFILIASNAVDSVRSGGGRTFGIYFQEYSYPGDNLMVYHLNTPVFYLGGMPFTPFLILFFISMIPIVYSVHHMVFKHNKTKYRNILIIVLTIDIILWILQSKGV